MKEKITRKVEKECRGPHTSVKGRVCHSSQVSEREATPSGDINNLQPVIQTEIRIRIFPEERCVRSKTCNRLVKIMFQRRNNILPSFLPYEF